MFRDSCGQKLNLLVQGIFVVTLVVLLGKPFVAQDTLALSSNRASTYPSANAISASLSHEASVWAAVAAANCDGAFRKYPCVASAMNAGIVSSGKVVSTATAQPATAVSPAKASVWSVQFAPNTAGSSACEVTLTRAATATSASPILIASKRTPFCEFSCPLTQANAGPAPTARAWVGVPTAGAWCEAQPDGMRPGYPAWVGVPTAATSATFSATFAAPHNGSSVNPGVDQAATQVSSMAYKQVTEPAAELSSRRCYLLADQPS
jgi:hypothetical protein